jgi:type 1 fimbriae regulatory protein FimB/type 1 fimbriae regulatory protein FimE
MLAACRRDKEDRLPGEEAGVDRVSGAPHMLREAIGHYIASKGHDTRAIQANMGHCNIQPIVRYTVLLPERFKDFWRD